MWSFARGQSAQTSEWFCNSKHCSKLVPKFELVWQKPREKEKKKNGKFVVFSLRMYDIYEKVFLCIFQIILGSVFNVIFVFILW